MSYFTCIDLSGVSIPAKTEEGETWIIHVQFHGTDRNAYNVNPEKLESTLLTEYLRKIEGPDLSQTLMKLTFDITPADEATDSFCKSVLEGGIFCRQLDKYFFLGHSDEQLKTKSCYLMRASEEQIHEHLAKFGDFLEEKNIEKRARNIGMLFLPLNKVVPLATKEYKIQPDITGGITTRNTFTDGCGFMSKEFSSEVQRIFELDYQPSAVHLRYRGIEGMLVLKEDLKDVKVQFHTSMQKFVTPDENMPEDFSFADAVDYSRPYVNGYLDTRMVMLLVDRGVFAQNLYDLQEGYHKLLKGMCKETAEYFLYSKGEFRLLQDIRDKGIDSTILKRLKGLRKQELDEIQKAAYTRILVPKSRLVYAVCDPYKKLDYGECYFNPTKFDDEPRGFYAGQKFVVMRDPCYHPGDVRVLKMTKEKQGYENLRDCLVLPVKGPRPHAFECSGGDLGGNKLFVTWDDKLIPKEITAPCAYPPKRTPGSRKVTTFVPCCPLSKTKHGPESRNKQGREELREYFAFFKDDLTEKIDMTYMMYAAAFGPSSKECRKLSKMFYQATDVTHDRVALEKKWLKLRNAEPRAKGGVLSRDTGTLSERSHLINDAEKGNEDDQIPLIGYKVREEINKNAETFAGENGSKRIV